MRSRLEPHKLQHGEQSKEIQEAPPLGEESREREALWKLMLHYIRSYLDPLGYRNLGLVIYLASLLDGPMGGCHRTHQIQLRIQLKISTRKALQVMQVILIS